jgi:hypothetical protein
MNNNDNVFDMVQSALNRIDGSISALNLKLDNRDAVINQLVNDVDKNSRFIATFKKGFSWIIGIIFTGAVTFGTTAASAHMNTHNVPYISEKHQVQTDGTIQTTK